LNPNFGQFIFIEIRHAIYIKLLCNFIFEAEVLT